jgi:SAM-dependent methyltransferase
LFSKSYAFIFPIALKSKSSYIDQDIGSFLLLSPGFKMNGGFLYSPKDKTFPDYSPFAGQYAQSRPGYPEELFGLLASLVKRRRLAWDCATGNGQAALGLVNYFTKIVATDISDQQINHAIAHPQIEYRIAGSEQSGLEDKSVDLVTVASAIHWFDPDSFYLEIKRVVRPGGVLAAWTYHVGHVVSPFDKVFHRFYYDILFTYFNPGARLVDDRYESLVLPGKPLPSRDFQVSARWNFDQMLAFIHSWSGTQQYINERGEDPVVFIEKELSRIWGSHSRIHTVRWPLYLKISRI